jgi:hypothetical protein
VTDKDKGACLLFIADVISFMVQAFAANTGRNFEQISLTLFNKLHRSGDTEKITAI